VFAINLPELFVFPGETLLSPLVMCGPHGLKFLKPVELRLPHCASMTPDGWSFALKSSDSSSGMLCSLFFGVVRVWLCDYLGVVGHCLTRIICRFSPLVLVFFRQKIKAKNLTESENLIPSVTLNMSENQSRGKYLFFSTIYCFD